MATTAHLAAFTHRQHEVNSLPQGKPLQVQNDDFSFPYLAGFDGPVGG